MIDFQTPPPLDLGLEKSQFLPDLEVDEVLEKIKDSHAMYCHLINIEIWAIVETMDDFFPGSWSRFMANRQLSLKQFLQNHANKGPGSMAPESAPETMPHTRGTELWDDDQ